MPQRPSRVIRSSELRASRGKSRMSLRGEIDDIRSDLTKTEEEARRKQAFYDAVKFYRKANFYGDVVISNDDGTLASFRAPFGGTPVNTIAFNAGVTFSDYVAFSTSAALDSLLDSIFSSDVARTIEAPGFYGSGYVGAATGTIRFNAAASFSGARSFGTSTGARTHYIFENGNGDVGSISTSGTATAFNTSSDVSQKDNIEAADIEDALARVLAIQIHDFTWKADGSVGRGVLAHELQAVMPFAVTGNPGDVRKEWVTVDDRGAVRIEMTMNDEPLEFERDEAHPLGIERPAPQMVDYSKIVPDLVLAVQALAAKVTQ